MADGESVKESNEGGGDAGAAARELERIRGGAGRTESGEQAKTEDHPPPATDPHPRKPFLRRASDALSTTGRVLAALWLVALTLFLVRSVWTTLSGVQIGGEFEVPTALAAQGYGGSVAKDLLAEKVRTILSSARRSGRADSASEEALFLDEGSDAELSSLKIPGTGLSVQSVVALVLAAVGKAPRQVTGGLVQGPSGTALHLSIFDGPSVEISSPAADCSGDCLDGLLEQGARRVAQRISPIALVAYLLDRDPPACEEAIRYCLRERPTNDDAAAYNYWGVLLGRQGDYEGAQRKLAQALALAKQQGSHRRFEASIENNWGLMMFRQRDLAGARQHLAAAVAADASLAKAHHNMGTVARMEGKLDEAVAESGKATDRDGQLAAAYFQQAEALVGLHRAREALKLLDKAEALGLGNPRGTVLDPALYMTSARILDSLGRHDEALAKAERALDIAPDSPVAQQLVAQLRVKAQRRRPAR